MIGGGTCNYSNAILIGALLAFFLIGGFVGGYKYHKSTVSRELDNAKYYKTTYLRKTGASQGYGSYNLLSFDGGRNWYAVDRKNDGQMIILGSAEKIFPGLLAHLDGLDRLVKYVENNGPINLGGPRAAEGIKALEGAGFQVKAE